MLAFTLIPGHLGNVGLFAFIAVTTVLVVTPFRSTPATALTREDCEADYQVCTASSACDVGCLRQCQRFYLLCLSKASDTTKAQ